MDKLAEEIIKTRFGVNDLSNPPYYPTFFEELGDLMEIHHSAKMQEVTDEDIEVKANDIANPESILAFERGEWLGFKEGAKAMRDGEIKHKEG